jgi:hypothetical protein
MATATVHTRTELRVFYSLVLGLALYGQSTGASSWLVPDDASHLQAALLWVLVIAFVLVLELGAVVLLRRAETQRRAGERAWVAIFAAIVLAGGAAGLSWIGHWGTSTSAQIQSWAFAGATLLGVLVWAIMADLSIDATVSRHRAVESAVRRYVKDLSMDGSEKSVLLATMDVPMITRLITGGPDALTDADGRDRNVRIAKILAVAIDPDTWHGQDAKPAAKKAAGAAAPAPALVSTPASAPAAPKPAAPRQPRATTAKPRAPRSRDEARERLLAAWKGMREEMGDRPPCRALADAAGVGKSLAANWLNDHLAQMENGHGQEQAA